MDEPKRPEPPFAPVAWGGGNADAVSVDCRRLLLPSAGLLPNMLELLAVPDESDPNPPLLAKPAKPPEEGAGDAAAPGLPPKTLFPDPRAAKPDCPNEGVVVDVAAVAQGEVLTPTVDEAPNADGRPKAGVEDAGVVPKELDPKLGFEAAGVAGLAEAQGEGLEPSADDPPNAGAALGVEEPKTDPVAGLARDKAVGAAAVGAGVAGEASTAAIPGYVVPPLMDSEYITHQEQRIPSCVRTQYPGTGPGDSSISSVGIGLYTVSLADRSSAQPTGIAFCQSSVIGRVARLESSAISVVVKTLVMSDAALSVVRGVLDLLSRPMSEDAVDAMMSKS